ncbi:MAG: ligand-binding sensor domain-containing protein [Bacteroidia bacterium]
MPKRIFLFLFICCSTITFAQPANLPVLQHISAGSLGVKSVAFQSWDHSGKMWGVYNDGLFSYDGYRCKKWPNTNGKRPGLLSASILSMYLDREDVIWVSYEDTNAVSCFNTRDYTFSHFKLFSGIDKTPLFPIRGFKEDSQNNFWALCWGQGISKVDKKNRTCKSYAPQKTAIAKDAQYANRVKDLVELGNGTYMVVYFANEGAEFMPQYFNSSAETFTNFNINDYLGNCAPNEANIISQSIRISHFLHVDQDGNFWFGTYSGLMFIDLKNKQSFRISGHKGDTRSNLDNTKTFETDDDDNLWIGTPNNGVMIVNKKRKSVNYLVHSVRDVLSIADNRIGQIKKDPGGNIWISTAAGFSIANPIVQQFNIVEWKDLGLEFANRSEQRIPLNQMLVGKNGSVYLSNEAGISIYNVDSGKVTGTVDPSVKLNATIPIVNWRSRSSINDISFLSPSKLLIISPHSPAIYDLRTGSYSRPKDLNDTLRDRFRHLLFRHSPPGKKPLIYSINFAHCLREIDTTQNVTRLFHRFKFDKQVQEKYAAVLSDGRWFLMFGEKEFMIFDPVKKTETVYGYHQQHGFPDTTIRIAYADKDHHILIGTAHGLYSFDYASGKTESLNAQMGIGNEPVNAIIRDRQGQLWIALTEILLRFDPATNKVLRIGKELGLRSGSFIESVAQQDSTGRIYIASFNGAFVFDPSRIKISEAPPKLKLELMGIREDTLNDARLSSFLSGDNELAWNQNFLNFEFGTNQVFSLTPNLFYYRIIGLDTSWQTNFYSNRLRLMNLSPGSYTLQARIINGYNVKGEVLDVCFKIRAPFWQTWWFWSFVLALLGTSAYMYLRYRDREFIKQQQVLEQRITERTEEIRHQKEVIEEKNKALLDSIHYAQRIQRALIPNEKLFDKLLRRNRKDS